MLVGELTDGERERVNPTFTHIQCPSYIRSTQLWFIKVMIEQHTHKYYIYLHQLNVQAFFSVIYRQLLISRKNSDKYNLFGMYFLRRKET